MKKKVLILSGYYIPSVKGGGPIQSIKNLIDNLSSYLEFYIITSDRDLGDKRPFKNIQVDKWVKVGNANVFYTDVSKLSWEKVTHLVSYTNFDVLYLNSFFSYKFSIIPVILAKLNKIHFKRIVLAPRGQFSEGSLGFKGIRKKLYIEFSKLLGLYENIIWHSTTINEKNDIVNIFGKNINIKVANNLTANYESKVYNKKITKKSGELKIAYISRIHPVKNLYQVLEILNKFSDNIEFNIYGPIEDLNYWEKCKKLISNMNANVEINYKGLIPNHRVIEILQKNHIFILLTLGENFGHAISEALMGGCPVIISDRTPWKGLEKHCVGWDLSLDNNSEIIDKIKYFVKLNDNEYKVMSRKAFEYGKIKANSSQDIGSYYDIFDINHVAC